MESNAFIIWENVGLEEGFLLIHELIREAKLSGHLSKHKYNYLFSRHDKVSHFIHKFLTMVE